MESKTKGYLIFGAVILLIILFIIPASHYTPPITSGRHVQDAKICNFSSNGESMKVQIYDTKSNKSRLTNCYLTIKGNIPASAYEGQDIVVGYSKDGLLDDPKQTVQISYQENTNALTA